VNEATLDVASPQGPIPTFVACPDGVGPFPVVIVYMDALGIREELREMTRRHARAGYFAMLPNLYHRAGGPSFDPSRLPEYLDPRAQALNVETTMAMVAADTGAMLTHAHSDPRARSGAAGCIGYCMGGRHAITAAATYPDRIAVAVSVHGGRLVTDAADSAHRRIGEARAAIHFAFADGDDSAPAEHLEIVRRHLDARAGLEGSAELHDGALHGFAFPERYCYDHDVAERVQARWLDMLDRHVR